MASRATSAVGALSKLPVTYPAASVEAIYDNAEVATYFAVEDPEPDSLADAIVELGRDLSPDARWALVNVARPDGTRRDRINSKRSAR